MRRYFVGLAAIVLVGLCGCSTPKMLSMPSLGGDGYLPGKDELPGWRRMGRLQRYHGGDLKNYMGRQSRLFESYGLSMLFAADYAPEGQEYASLTIESYQMHKPLAASGVFHHYRGRRWRGLGVPVDVGVAGFHVRKVLYFYKDRYFIKVIFTGKDKEQPNLVDIGRAMAAQIPGDAQPPRGFEFLNVEGVNPKDAYVSDGYTFNYDFLPPSISAKAPGAGSIARVHLISHYEEDEAARTARDYRFFLERNGVNYQFKRTSDSRLVWWARDANQGRIICTRYRKWVIMVLTPETYEQGEVILDRMIALMPRRG